MEGKVSTKVKFWESIAGKVIRWVCLLPAAAIGARLLSILFGYLVSWGAPGFYWYLAYYISSFLEGFLFVALAYTIAPKFKSAVGYLIMVFSLALNGLWLVLWALGDPGSLAYPFFWVSSMSFTDASILGFIVFAVGSSFAGYVIKDGNPMDVFD